MFEYNGTQFTLAEVEAAAAKRNLSLDDYINQFGIKKIDSQPVEKPQPVAETTAPAAGQTPDTGLQLESGSLESQSEDPALGVIDQIFKPDVERNETYEQREVFSDKSKPNTK